MISNEHGTQQQQQQQKLKYNVFLHGIASKGKIESMKSFARKK